MEIKDQVDSLARSWEEFKSANDKRLAEIEKKGSADVLFTPQLEKINAFMDDAKAKLDLMEKAANRPSMGAGEEKSGDAYSKVLTSYLRKGTESGFEEFKSMSVSTDSEGGYLVSPAMSAQVIKVQNETSPMRQLATVETISTDSLDIIIDRDTTTSGGWTGEQSTRSASATPTLGKRNIPAHEMYAIQKATQKIIDDSAVNIESWLADKIAERFALDEATSFISGNGSSRPRGILGYTPAEDSSFAWGNPSYIASGTSAIVTADGLINLVTALKENYARNASFLMKRATEGAVRTLKDGQGNYLWRVGLEAGKPNMLLGSPVYQAADMQAIAADAYAVAYGDFKQAYTIVDRVGVRVLRDQYTDKPFIQFYATKRVGGDVTNFEAYKLLKLAAS